MKQKQKEEMADIQDFIGKIRQLSQEKEAMIQSLETENHYLRSENAQLALESETRIREAEGKEELVRELAATKEQLEELKEIEKEKAALEEKVIPCPSYNLIIKM